MQRIFTVYQAGNNSKYIVGLEITLAQIRHTLRRGHVSPKKSKGACPKLNLAQIDEVEISFLLLMRRDKCHTSNFPDWKVSEKTVKNDLITNGYSRCLSRSRLPKLEENRCIRKAFAEAHLQLTQEDWSLMLWSDGKIISQYITWKISQANLLLHTYRPTIFKIGEEYDRKAKIKQFVDVLGFLFWIAIRRPSILRKTTGKNNGREFHQTHTPPSCVLG